MSTKSKIIPKEHIEQNILMIRGHKVILDTVLARLYDETTKRLNQQVRRNLNRFPEDFMFQLTEEEYESLRLHSATLKVGRGVHRKYLPYVFTEQGVAMLSSVLKSDRAVEVNIEIMRAFVRLRLVLTSSKVLSKRMEELEKKHASHDQKFKIVFDAIRQLMTPPISSSRKIGFERE